MFLTASHLFSSRLWAVCLLWSIIWYLQHDDTNGHRSRPVRGNHQASGIPRSNVSQESLEHCGRYLGLLNGLELAPLLWLEWVWPGKLQVSGAFYLCHCVRFQQKVRIKLICLHFFTMPNTSNVESVIRRQITSRFPVAFPLFSFSLQNKISKAFFYNCTVLNLLSRSQVTICCFSYWLTTFNMAGVANTNLSQNGSWLAGN